MNKFNVGDIIGWEETKLINSTYHGFIMKGEVVEMDYVQKYARVRIFSEHLVHFDKVKKVEKRKKLIT